MADRRGQSDNFIELDVDELAMAVEADDAHGDRGVAWGTIDVVDLIRPLPTLAELADLAQLTGIYEAALHNAAPGQQRLRVSRASHRFGQPGTRLPEAVTLAGVGATEGAAWTAAIKLLPRAEVVTGEVLW